MTVPEEATTPSERRPFRGVVDGLILRFLMYLVQRFIARRTAVTVSPASRGAQPFGNRETPP